jgi:hypothetical protein
MSDRLTVSNRLTTQWDVSSHVLAYRARRETPRYWNERQEEMNEQHREAPQLREACRGVVPGGRFSAGLVNRVRHRDRQAARSRPVGGGGA